MILSLDIWDYISELLAKASDLSNRMSMIHDNQQKIVDLMSTWITRPLFERREKQDNLLGISDRNETIKKRNEEIMAAGFDIHTLVEVLANFAVK